MGQMLQSKHGFLFIIIVIIIIGLPCHVSLLSVVSECVCVHTVFVGQEGRIFYIIVFPLHCF